MKLSRVTYGASLVVGIGTLYAPMVLVFIFSLNSAKRGMIWEDLSFHWYRDVWLDSILMNSLLNTVKVAILTSAISFLGGSAFGYLVSIASRKTFLVFTSLLLLPILTPDLIASLTQALFYQFIGVQKGLHTIALSQSFFGVAYVGLFVCARLRSVDFSQYLLASASLGASPSQSFRDHFVPLALPAALSGAAIVSVLSIQDFLYAFFCGGAGSTTLSVKLFSLVKFGVSSGINVIYVVLVLSAVLIVVVAEFYFGRLRRL